MCMYNSRLVWWWYIESSSKCGCQCAICLTHIRTIQLCTMHPNLCMFLMLHIQSRYSMMHVHTQLQVMHAMLSSMSQTYIHASTTVGCHMSWKETSLVTYTTLLVLIPTRVVQVMNRYPWTACQAISLRWQTFHTSGDKCGIATPQLPCGSALGQEEVSN